MAHAGEVVDELQRVREAAEERQLVTSAADGSAVAFEQIYRRHSARIHALCLRMTGNVATAEDCTQEAFVQAWRNASSFDPERDVAPWLVTVARRAAIDIQRREARRPSTALDLETAIAGLPPGARHVLVLVGVYGHSHEEASQLLGIAVGTCKAQLHRARALLSARLGDTR